MLTLRKLKLFEIQAPDHRSRAMKTDVHATIVRSPSS